MSELLKNFGADGSRLLKMDTKQFKSLATRFNDRFQGSLRKTTGRRLLKEYSPWLSSFQGDQYSQSIEIPGEDDMVQ